MNTLTVANDELAQFQLRKVTCFWGFKEGNYVYYMLAPPWVKFKVVSIAPHLFPQNDVVNQV